MKPLWMAIALTGLLLGALGRAQEDELVELRLFNGQLLRGQVVKDEGRELLLRTLFGDRKVARQEVVDFRSVAAPDERAELQRGLAALSGAGQAAPSAPQTANTPRPEPPAPRGSGTPAETPSPLLVRARAEAPPPVLSPGRMYSWEERMFVGLSRRVSVEFVDERLEDALATLAAVTGLNIIVDPKLRVKQLRVSLAVRAMDAEDALKWITRLTGTYLELANQALYVTDKPSPTDQDEERMEALALMAQAGVDPAILPPAGQPLTDMELAQIALAIWEKESPKLTDFPAPEIDLGRNPQSFLQTPFGGAPKP